MMVSRRRLLVYGVLLGVALLAGLQLLRRGRSQQMQPPFLENQPSAAISRSGDENAEDGPPRQVKAGDKSTRKHSLEKIHDLLKHIDDKLAFLNDNIGSDAAGPAGHVAEAHLRPFQQRSHQDGVGWHLRHGIRSNDDHDSGPAEAGKVASDSLAKDPAPRVPGKSSGIRDDLRPRLPKEVLDASEAGTKLSDSSLRTLRSLVTDINDKQTIYNLQAFEGDLDLSSCPVLLVMVHNRYDYFRVFLESASRVKDIHKALLVVSSDIMSVELLDVLDGIDFMPFSLAFFQHSLQLYPDSFPGDSPEDCPRDASMSEARRLGCINADTPDMYGHYREAKFTVIKHHWWWKLNFVFAKFRLLQKHQGPVVLLEEDHYLVPDLIDFLAGADGAPGIASDPLSSMLVLGSYSLPPASSFSSTSLARTTWITNKHNMGMVLHRALYNLIAKCAADFCSFDDYNWDWSLLHLFRQPCFGQQGLTAVLPAAPRVIHIGACGVHQQSANCAVSSARQEADRAVRNAEPFLFPSSSFQVAAATARKVKLTPNGGWGDPRDALLCKDMVNM